MFTVGLIIFGSIFLNQKTHAVAGINRQINFQGKLVDNPTGVNVADVSYTVIFTIYDNSSGGTALWTETQSVTTADGIFRVALGSVTSFPANFNFNWDGLYLGMKVNSDDEMTPRVQLAAVPYAFNAEKVSGLTVQDTSGNASTSGTFKMANAKTFTVNNTLGLSGTDGKTLTFNNSITLAGTDAKTLNIGANNLTFDTSAGDSTLVLPTSGTVCVNTNNCGYTTGTNWWTTSADNKALTPINSTMDLLVGGTTTASAKFAVLNMDSNSTGTPTASVSAGTNGGAYLTATGNLQTTAFQALSLGGATTGDIFFTPKNIQSLYLSGIGGRIGVGTQIAPKGLLDISGDAGNNATLIVNNSTANGDIFAASSSGTTQFRITNNGYASASAGFTINGAGNLQTTNNNTLTIGGDTTGELILKSRNATVFKNPTSGTGQSTFVGELTGSSASLGNAVYATALGYGAIRNNTTGSYNTAVGYEALLSNTAGHFNTAVGLQSLFLNTGSGNTTQGLQSLFSNTTGSYNTALGYQAGKTSVVGNANTIGTYNTFLGYNSGPGGTNWLTNATAIGSYATVTCPNCLVLGSIDGINAATASARVGIGIASPLGVLDIAGGNWGGNAALIVNQTGATANDIFTASASGITKFRITNDGTASSSAGFTINGAGNLQTTNAQTLTLGGDTTGNIVIDSGSSQITLSDNTTISGTLDGLTGLTLTSGSITLGGSTGTGNCLTGGATASWGSCGGGGSSNWTLDTTNGVLRPNNNTLDFFIGGTASSAAQFAVLGVVAGSSPVASLSATTGSNIGQGLSFTSSNATIQSLIKGTLTIGGDTTGSIRFIPGALSSSSLFLKNNGDIGIGPNNTNPLASFDVRVNTANAGGTIAVASVSGKTSFAGLVVDNSGVGDIFTASSGLTRFVVKQSGVVQIGNSTNGLTFDYINGGPTYSGSARPSKQIVLSPEYAGAILTASASATTDGSMTSDASASATLSNFRTYYEWSSAQAILQDYTVAVRVTLPQDFSDWNTTAGNAMHINFNTASTVVATNRLDALIYNTDSSLTKPGNPVVYQQAQVSATEKTWKTLDIDRADLIDNAEALDTAGETMIIYLKMYSSGTYNYTQVGDIVLNYLSKF